MAALTGHAALAHWIEKNQSGAINGEPAALLTHLHKYLAQPSAPKALSNWLCAVSQVFFLG